MEQAIKDRLKALETSLQLDPQQQTEDPALLVTELILDGRKFRQVLLNDAVLLSKFPNLMRLSCNQTGLSSLNGFPQIPSLKIFEVTDNHISGSLECLVSNFPNLKRIELGGNFIKSFEEILPLKGLLKLVSLGLELNPITEIQNYRETVLSNIPQLQILDSVDRLGNEHDGEEDAEEEYEDDEEDAEDGPTLRDFYEKDYSEDDDEDDDEFEPGEDEEDEEIEDEDDVDIEDPEEPNEIQTNNQTMN